MQSSSSSSSNDATKRKKNGGAARATAADFVSTMTFATQPQHGRGFCDCDECEIGTNGNNIAFIPNAIQQALNEYKRQKKAHGGIITNSTLLSTATTVPSLRRTQHRQLMRQHHLKQQQRKQDVEDPSKKKSSSSSSSKMLSIWQWTLPLHAEPLLEFGDSHRFIWVQRMPRAQQQIPSALAKDDGTESNGKNAVAKTTTTTTTTDSDGIVTRSVLKEIGTGIVGSSAEEQGRRTLDWEENGVYFLPSRQGKAIGWVHQQQQQEQQAGDDEKLLSSAREADTASVASTTTRTATAAATAGPIVLHVVKVSPGALESFMDQGATPSPGNNQEQRSSLIPEATNQPERGGETGSSGSSSSSSSTPWYDVILPLCQRLLQRQNSDDDDKNTNQASSTLPFLQLDAADTKSVIQICRSQ